MCVRYTGTSTTNSIAKDCFPPSTAPTLISTANRAGSCGECGSGPVAFITHFFSLVATKLESLVEPSDASCDVSL